MDAQPGPGEPGDTLLDLPSAAETDAVRERDRARVHAALFGGASPATQADHETLRFGRYAVIEKLGEGAMGEVYRAADPLLERDVAIKVVHRRLAGRADRGVPRLLQEARSMAKLRHPNVVGVYEAGLEGDVAWIAMEYVRGESLRAWLRAAPRSVDEILRCLIDAGRGLSAAHEAGLVHRDFKPDNVLVDHEGRARVSDFGLVRSFQDQNEPSTPTADARGEVQSGSGGTLTREGAILGTPAYMPPEQLAGDPVDASCDQFAFCVTAWEALFGVRPFGGDDPIALCGSILAGNLRKRRSAGNVPRRVERVLRRGMSARAKHRYPSMGELLVRLEVRRKVALLGGATLLMFAAAGGRVLVGAAAERNCAAPEHELAGVWDKDMAGAMEERMLSSHLPYAEVTAAAVRQVLDDRAASWNAAWTRACVSRVQAVESPQQIDERVACLNARRADLAAMARRLSSADTTTLSHAHDAALHLASASDCDQIDGTPTLASAETRERLDPVLSTARSLRLVGYPAAGIGAALAVEIDAAQVGASDYVAKARSELGELRLAVGDYIGAAAAWHSAVDAAVVAGDEHAQAEAWFSLAKLAANERRQAAQARESLGHGDALLDRSPARHALLMRRRLTAAYVLAIENPESALSTAQSLIEQANLDDPNQVMLRDEAVLFRCPLLLDLARWGEAEQAYRERIEEATARYGGAHPNVAAAWFGLGIALDRQGQIDGKSGAENAYQVARRMWRATWPGGHRDIAAAGVALANIAQRRRNLTLAEMYADEAMVMYQQVLSPDDVAFGEMWTLRGVLQHRRGNYGAAAISHDAARSIYESATGGSSLEAALARSNAAEARVRDGVDDQYGEFEWAYSVILQLQGSGSPILGYALKGAGLAALQMHDNLRAARDLGGALILCSVDRNECEEVLDGIGTAISRTGGYEWKQDRSAGSQLSERQLQR